MPDKLRLPKAPEMQLLLACVQAHFTTVEEAFIRQLLDAEFDWTLFTRKAIDHGLGGMAGHMLNRLVPDSVPDDILIAFRVHNNRVRERNHLLFGEFKNVAAVLSKQGVDVIPLRAPILAFQAYDDPACREFSDIDFLVQDADLTATMTSLGKLGYERDPKLSDAQSEMTQRLEGRESIFNPSSGISLRLHTRLIPLKMGLGIDYSGLLRRTQRTTVNGSAMVTLAPEDTFLLLVIHGGKDLWRRIIWACDVAAFIGSHPDLDWKTIIDRAASQGCLGSVLLAVTLARRYFKAAVPDAVIEAERVDSTVEPLAARVLASWIADDPAESSEDAMQSKTPPTTATPVAVGPHRPPQAQDGASAPSVPPHLRQYTFDVSASPSFAAWLAEMDSSIAVTSIASNMLFLIGSDADAKQLAVSQRPMQRAMGIAFDGQRLAIAARSNIVTFTNAMAGRSNDDGNECIFVPRFSNRTGVVDAHDLAFDAKGNYVFVNTTFSCLASTSATHSFRPIWQPAFISQLVAEDRCHLNGLALRDGRPAYVTAFAESDAAEGWRNLPAKSGVIIDIETNEIVCGDLTKPHSPRWHQGNLWVLNSGTGEIGVVDLNTGRFNPVAFCPGFLRGLDFAGPYALVSTSGIRSRSASVGLALLERLEREKREARCGVHVIDARSGEVLHNLNIEGGTNELYDVIVLPKIPRPTLEPAEQDETITIEV
jgi:uncharacterized protein (TIGR03032 family)